MVAVLTKMLGFGNFQQAEDLVQDTLMKALSAWKVNGIPENPSAWMHTVAKRAAIDLLRQRKVHEGIHAQIAQAMRSEFTLAPAVNQMFAENEIQDSQLRMIFACCHPSIVTESQIALTLRTLCGLSVGEIARAFLTTEDTITKRLYRAREKIRAENISLEAPLPVQLRPRLAAVLHSLYLLFNEGYYSSHSDRLIRQDLTLEAMRLCLLLTRNPLTNLPPVHALLALMCLQASREDARLGGKGEIIRLQEQDRNRWDRHLIERGLYFLNTAWGTDEISEYHLEAAIAACHSMAKTFGETNWAEIHRLYELLEGVKPGPVVAMHKAIAVGYWKSPEEGLRALTAVEGMEENHIYHAAIAEFHALGGERDQATQALARAIALTSSARERELLEKKKGSLLE